MPRDISRDALYGGDINLWVEDGITRIYLSKLWNDPDIKLLIGGGNEGVGAILKDAEDAGYTNVFGVIDRDFRKSNYDDWFLPHRTFRRFILPKHEVENYLLDRDALQGNPFNTHRKTAAEIESILLDEASRRCWWSACREVISHIHDRFVDGFMMHPKMPPVDSRIAAKDHIRSSDWFRALPRRAAAMTETRIDRMLTRSHARALRLLGDGRWRSEFSGKEIFRAVGNRIFNRAGAPVTYNPTSAEFDADLAEAIATWQVANNAVPDELADLLTALKARIAP